MNEAIPTPHQTTSTDSKLGRGFCFALIGLVFGFLGLGTAAYRMSVKSERPLPPKRKEISDVPVDTIKKTADKFCKQPTPAPHPAVVTWPVSKWLGLAASICGFI